jgi:glutathione peroxidase-family protein
MKKIVLLYIFACTTVFGLPSTAQQHPTLAIGSPAPNFNLKGIDGKYYSLNSFKRAKVLVIIFMCNHCPTSQAYEQRIIQLTNDYKNKGVAVVGINPNNPASLRLDELGYSDVGDSFEDMKVRAKDKQFNFPYLYDGETEVTANKYRPVSTPHAFIFDGNRELRYQGRIDDMENPHKTPRSLDARNAIEALLNNEPVPVETTKVFGCSIKWIEKKDWIQKARVKWAAEPVTIAMAEADSVKGLLQNSSDKLRLINIWSLKNISATKQFPGFVTMHRMYRDRGFEFMSINIDELNSKDSVLAFLKKQEASGPNYLFTGSENALRKIIDLQWVGTLPYTILVEPGGKIVYAKQGIVDPEMMKKTIFNDPLIGRVYN